MYVFLLPFVYLFPLHLHEGVLEVNSENTIQNGTLIFRSILACPPPKAPEFEPFFVPIRNLLLSPVLIRILRVILIRTAKRSRYSSDGLLHRVSALV